MLNRAEIEKLIPHAGRMVLIDEVWIWNADTILCATRCHRDDAMPLRRDGRLPSAAGIEIAGQAMAIHAALVERQQHKGILAAVRTVRLMVDRLDDIDADLIVAARRELGGLAGAVYQFAVGDGGNPLLSGRITVVMHRRGWTNAALRMRPSAPPH